MALVENNHDVTIDYAIWSPTGSKIAYVLNHDVYIRDMSAYTERVTYDGGAEIFNGVADWVFEGPSPP
jgi:Dipeptidyl peptidase IV (DPP IV) N-terminal region